MRRGTRAASVNQNVFTPKLSVKLEVLETRHTVSKKNQNVPKSEEI